MDTSSIVAITFGILFAITSVYAIIVTIRLQTPAASAAPGVPSGLSNFFKSLVDFLQTWFGLTPYMFFFAGFIIDVLSSQYMYSKASLVGAVTVLLTAIFGSSWFAKISKNIVGFIPPIRTPGGAPGVPDEWNWLPMLIWLIIGTLVFLPMMIGKLSGLAWGGSVGIAALFGLIALAGNELLGDSIPVTTTNPSPAATTSAGITNNNLCVTPGLEGLQTRFAPVGIILSTSILSAHMFEAIDTQNNSATAMAGSLAGISFAIEYGIMMAKGCFTQYKYKGYAPFISLGIGFLSGAVAYYTMKQTGQESFTTQTGGIFHPQQIPKAKRSDGEKLSTKIVVGPPEETSEPVDDQDAFVCEAYKDGELVTSTLVE